VCSSDLETRADVAELRSLGCEYAQGYVFGEPMSGEDARRLLARSFRSAAQ
jgi:EAL domain-containing protein (putative c-di-GMP-specific phosphodiesterase class I)